MKRYLALLSILALLVPVFAQDRSSYGLPLIGTRVEEGHSYTVVADPDGKEILLDAQSDPDQARVQALITLVTSLRSYKGATIDDIRVINYPDRFQLLALPTRFVVGRDDVAARIPGGIQIFYTNGNYEYDFRLKSGDFFVRLRGLYISLPELSLVMARVLKDPAAYVLSGDPLYALKRFDDYEARITSLESSNTRVIADNAQLKKDLTASIATAAANTVAATAAANAATAAATSSVSAKMAADVGRIQVALMAALAGGKPIKPEVVQKIIDIHKDNPALEHKNYGAKLKEATLSASQKEIDAVLLVMFGE